VAVDPDPVSGERRRLSRTVHGTRSEAKDTLQREKHNLTQVELAEKAGVPQAQISRIERGVVSPTSATLGKIAEPLGADLRLVERPQPSARRRAAN
jgi:transcriptional regulator with XRE-family HTH domain